MKALKRLRIAALSAIAVCFANAATIIDVRDFGAVAGSEDATATRRAFQRALDVAMTNNAPLVVKVGPGVYSLDSSLHIFSNTKLSLDEDTILKRKDSPSGTMLMGMHMSEDGTKCPKDGTCRHYGYSQVVNVTVEGGTWDAAATPNDNVGMLHLCHGSNIVVRASNFRNATNHPINISGSTNVLVEDCSFSSQIKYTANDPEFWGSDPVGFDARYRAIECVHMDATTAESEKGNCPEDGTVCRAVVVKDCVFDGVFAGIGNHHEGGGPLTPGLDVIDCEFRDLLGCGIMAFGFEDLLATGCVCTNCSRLIWGSGSTGITVENCCAEDCRDQTVALEACTGSKVFSNELLRGKSHGVSIDGGTASVAGNLIADCATFGIYAYNRASVKATGNEIERAESFGIAASASAITAQGNTIAECRSSAIHITESTDAVVTGNDVTAPAAVGIIAQNSSKSLIAGNTVSDSADIAILLLECRGTSVERNEISSPRSDGICCSGGDAALLSNKIAAPSRNGILANANASITAIGNEITDSASNGISLSGAAKGEILRNTISNVLGSCILAMNTPTPTICENRLFSAERHGVYIEAAQDATVAWNNLANLNSIGICVASSSGTCKVEENAIDGTGGIGIFASSVSSPSITSNRVALAGQQAIAARDCASSTISANRLLSSGGNGVSIEGGHAEIDGNMITGAGNIGVYMYSGASADVRGNVIASPTSHGLCAANGASVTALSNRLLDVGSDAVYLNESQNSVIEDNEIRSPARFGVFAKASAETLISGNTLSDSGSNAMQFSDCTGTRVVANTIANPNGQGIFCSAGDIDIHFSTISQPVKNGVCVTDEATAQLTGVEIDQPGDNGIYFKSTGASAVKDCSISNATQNGIYAYTCRNLKIAGSSFTDSGKVAICIVSSQAELEWNSISGSSSYGILLNYSDGSAACGNYITGTGDHGIFAQGSFNSDISLNTVSGVSGMGIYVKGASESELASATIVSNFVASTGSYAIRFGSNILAGSMMHNVCTAPGEENIVSSVTGVVQYEAGALGASVILLPCGGTGGDASAARDASAVAPPVRDDWVFKGYFSEPGGNGVKVFDENGQTTGRADILADTMFLFAQWTPDEDAKPHPDSEMPPAESLPVLLLPCGGIAAESSFDATKPPASVAIPVRDGFTFTGFFTSPLCNGDVIFDESGEAMASAADLQAGEFLYAAWTENPATTEVVFNAMGGEPDQTTASVEIGSAASFPSAVARPNYTFSHWSPSMSGETSADASALVFWQEELFAAWVPDSYAISYALDGGTLPSYSPTSYSYGQTVVPAVPSRQGFEFIGWREGNAIRRGSTGDVTLSAVWEQSSASADDEPVNPTPTPGPGTEPGTNPGTDPGTDPGTNPGTDPGTDPGTNPGANPGTKPESDAQPELFTSEDAYAFTGNATYSGWVRDKNGALQGTLTVKFSKPNRKTGIAKPSISYLPIGGKKKTIKLDKSDYPVVGESTSMTIPGIGTVLLGGTALTGLDVDVQAGVNGLKSKDATIKADTTSSFDALAGAWTFALKTDSGYSSFSLSMTNKGKGKLTGTFPDGAKISISTQGVRGEGNVALPFLFSKKGAFGLVFWIYDDKSIEISDLTNIKLPSGQTETAVTILPQPKGRLADGEHLMYCGLFDNAQPFSVSRRKWVFPRSDKKAAVNPNPYAAKLSFTEKSALVKGSFSVSINGAPKPVKFKVAGVVVGNELYGTAYAKSAGTVDVGTIPTDDDSPDE